VKLQTLIDVMLTTRIVVQFGGQIGALVLLRRLQPEMERPFRMWLYPLPALLALGGWLFLLFTTEKHLLAYGALALLTGGGVFMLWSRVTRKWPFAAA
jgi:hypothetical protein